MANVIFILLVVHPTDRHFFGVLFIIIDFYVYTIATAADLAIRKE